MKSIKFLLAVIFLIYSQILFGQQTETRWTKWKHLIGEWVGEGGGQPGQNKVSLKILLYSPVKL